MNYQFPVIRNLGEVESLVKDRKEFSVVTNDGYTYVCYNVVTPETFPHIESPEDAILRECRGITFCSETGHTISRKFHKFFNLGEREETLPENVDFSKSHVILEKLDGSMIVPVQYKDGWIRWHTKRGLSGTAMRAECFVAANPKYKEFAKSCLGIQYTPIFEWCSRQDKIVLDYPEDNLVLLAARHITTGNYLTHKELVNLAKSYDIPVVKQFDPEKYDTESLIKETGMAEDQEGIIIRFYDGHMIKVKSEWYCELHRVVSNFVYEYNIVRVVLEDRIDDFIAILRQHKHPLADSVEGYVKEFWDKFYQTKERAERKHHGLHEKYEGDRKGIATDSWMQNKASPLYRMLIFKICDGKDALDALKDYMLNKVTRNKNWLDIKSQCAFAELEWNGRNS